MVPVVLALATCSARVEVTPAPSNETVPASIDAPVTLDRHYTDESGRVWMATDCPAADILISGGEDAADGLPKKGQTDQDRVQFLVTEYGDYFLDQSGVAAVNVTPRNGEVWAGPGDGDFTVVEVEDFMVEVLIEDEQHCPSTPSSWNGIPVAYNLAGEDS